MLHKSNQELSKPNLIWSLSSFAILGLSGLVMNLIIGLYYSPESLGIFNQVFAMYIVFSQLGIMGLHNSLQKHTTEYLSLNKPLESIISSGLAIILISSSLSTILYVFIGPFFSDFIKSPSVKEGIQYSAVGLFFFAFNKSFLNILNAASRIDLFSGGNIIRSLSLILSIVYLSYSNVSPAQLCLSLTISEILVSIYCFTCLTLIKVPFFTPISKFWLRTHFQFGLRSILSGFLVEFNTRVDILILGIYLSDHQVGIYSFAALAAEGVAQLPTAFRANISPKLASFWAKKQLPELRSLTQMTIKKARIYLAGPILLSIILFPFIIPLLRLPSDYIQGWTSYSILVLGTLVSCGYLVLFNFFLMTGFPGTHSIILLIVCLTNAVMNLILVPLLNINGAALGTAISSLVLVGIFQFYIKRKIFIETKSQFG